MQLFRRLLRLFAFFAVFLIFTGLANYFLVKTDTYARMTLLEMKERHDLDVVFVGSSIVRDHFNNDIISKRTGLETFSATIPCLSMQGSIAITEELYRTNSPEYVVLVVEPYNFDTVREGIEAEDIMMPFLSSPRTMVDYYRRLVPHDGWYLNRLCLFRDFGITSFEDFVKTLRLRFNPRAAYERYRGTDPAGGIYQGHGFVRYDCEPCVDEILRTRVRREADLGYYELFDASREMLLEYRDLVERNGSKLLVLIFPNMNAQYLAFPSFLGYNDSLMRFCRENEIACVNYAFAKPELLPDLDPYFFDIYHVNGEGADIFSESFATFFNLYKAGADTAHLFYRNRWEYQDTHDRIPNVWIDRYEPGVTAWNMNWEQKRAMMDGIPKSKKIYVANANHVPGTVPEYRFVEIDERGRETVLQDYENTGILMVDPGRLDGRTLRVYARTFGGAAQNTVWNDYDPFRDPSYDNH